MNAPALHQILQRTAMRRPVFHSEADFQHELALEISCSGREVRLEVPRSVSINGVSVRVEIDLLVRSSKASGWTAIELKYVKEATVIVHDGEHYDLAGTWGTNLPRFDCLADLRRVECIVQAGHAINGHAVFLTNASAAWTEDVTNRRIMARQFSLHEGRSLPAAKPLDWMPGHPSVASVSAKRLAPYAPINLARSQICRWTDYSAFASPAVALRYLLLSA